MKNLDRNILSDQKFMILIFVVSILFRIIYLWQYHSSDYWGNFTVDANFHLQWAQSIANGNFWGNEVFFRAPLYSYLLAFFYVIASGKLLGIIIFQNIIGLVSLFLVYKLALNIFGRTASRITAIIYLLTFDFLFFESELLLDFLLVFFLPLIFSTIIRADKSGQKILWLTAGVLIGLAAATRPTTLILLFIIPLFFLKYRSKLFSFKNWLLAMLLVGAGTLVILLPIGIRNAVVGGEFSMLPSQGGINFYIGNNPEASGWSAAMPAPLGAFWQYADCRQIAEKESGHPLKPSQVSNYWMRKGLSFWTASPGRALGLTIRKSGLLISSQYLSNNRNIAQFKKQVPISFLLVVKWWLLIPFGVLGIIVSLKKNYRAQLLFIFVLVYSLTLILFFITSRFRLPLLPFWIIFAAQGMHYAYQSLQEKNLKRMAPICALIAGGFFLSFYNFYKVDFSNPQQELYAQGNRYFSLGNYDQAIRKYRDLLEANPAYPQAAMNIGAAYVRKGEIDSAEHFYQRELQFNPDSALTLSSLAEIYRLRGEPERAYQYARSAFLSKPYFTEVLINLCKAARADKTQSAALALISDYEQDYSTNPYFYFYRGVLYLDLAAAERVYLDSARIAFENTINFLGKSGQPTYERNPEIYARLFSDSEISRLAAMTYTNLGNVYFNENVYQQALEAFRSASQYPEASASAWRGLLESSLRLGDYQQALKVIDLILPEADSDNIQTLLLYQAQAYYNLKQTEQALEILQQIIDLYPENTTAPTIMEAIKKGG